MNYKSLSKIGNINEYDKNNPITYCLFDNIDSGFNHDSIGLDNCNKYSRSCQSYMSDFCSKNSQNRKLHPFCEFLSRDERKDIPNSLSIFNSPNLTYGHLTFGDTLIQNTASKKYLSEMLGSCELKHEQFDPTVVNSPYISYWVGKGHIQGNETCIPVYEVNHKEIDNDPIMNKILERPYIAWNILVNIYNTAIRKNKLNILKGTKLYNFFHSQYFQKKMLPQKQYRFC